jgi:hypothetical protein
VPHRLNAFLASTDELRQLSSKAKQVNALQQHYKLLVPPSLLQGSRILQLRQQVVVIAADNGAVANKLRQMTGELISLFQARGCEITGIQIKVQVTTRPLVGSPEPRVLSKAVVKTLTKLEESLADSPLKAALKRLARRA